MKNEKRQGFIEKIKAFFIKLFRKENVVALPNPSEKENKESAVSLSINKEEALELYNNVKKGNVLIESLTREQLIMFIALANEEIKILDKKIDNEITEANMYRKDIEFYESKLVEGA